MEFDIALRAAGVAVLMLSAAVLLASAPRSGVARAYAGLALGISGFLAVNTPYEAAELPAAWAAAASFASRMAAVFLWLFCLALFDGRPRSPRVAWTVVLIWLALVVADKEYLAPLPPGISMSPLQIVLGSGLLLHAGWRVLQDLRGDLVEPRRRARPLFALALLGILALDFGVDVVQGYGWRPAGFLGWQNGLLVALSAALAAWLLRAEAWVAALGSTPVDAARAAPPESDADAPVLARLDALMRQERPYLDPELTFAQFAARSALPEATLRRVINHRLGHGHFRTYLNAYRVAEAKRRLRGPEATGGKILAVALESGFSSLASFNRVFKQAVGRSPSEFRDG